MTGFFRPLACAMALAGAVAPPPRLLAAPARFSWQAVVDAQAQELGADVPEVRYRAIARLATFSAETAGPLLLPLVVAEPSDPKATQDAILAIGMLGYLPAAPALASVLASPLPDLRIATLRALGAMNATSYLPEVIRTLGDPQPSVRAAAAAALGMFAPGVGRADMVAPLVGRLQDKTVGVRLAALSSLAKLHDPRVPLAVASAMSDEHIDVRRAALTTALQMGTSAAAAALPLLRDPSPELRQLAARVLGTIGDRDSAIALLDATATATGSERGAMLVALAQLARRQIEVEATRRAIANASLTGDPAAAVAATLLGEAFAPMACAILDGQARGDVVLALSALAAAPAAASLDCIARELGRRRSPAPPLLGALAAIATPASVAILATYVSDPDPSLAAQALRNLAPLTALDPRTIDALAPLATHSDVATAILAIEGLGHTGDTTAVAILSPILQAANSSAAIKGATIDALGELRSPKALPVLLDRLGVATAAESTRLARAIVAIDDPAAVPRLTEIVASGATARGHALEALVLLARRHAVAPAFQPSQLRRWARGGDDVLAHAAIAGMMLAPSSETRDDLLTLARTADPPRAAQAACALASLPRATSIDEGTWIELLGHPIDAVAACAAEGLQATSATAVAALARGLTRGWATAINSAGRLACGYIATTPYDRETQDRLRRVLGAGSPLARWNANVALGKAPPTAAPSSYQTLSTRVVEPSDDIVPTPGAAYVAWTTCGHRSVGWAGYTDAQGWLDRPRLETSTPDPKFVETYITTAAGHATTAVNADNDGSP